MEAGEARRLSIIPSSFGPVCGGAEVDRFFEVLKLKDAVFHALCGRIGKQCVWRK